MIGRQVKNAFYLGMLMFPLTAWAALTLAVLLIELSQGDVSGAMQSLAVYMFSLPFAAPAYCMLVWPVFLLAICPVWCILRKTGVQSGRYLAMFCAIIAAGSSCAFVLAAVPAKSSYHFLTPFGDGVLSLLILAASFALCFAFTTSKVWCFAHGKEGRS